MIFKFLKSIFCKHELVFFRNIYGDEIIHSGWKRSIWECSKCNRFFLKDALKETTND